MKKSKIIILLVLILIILAVVIVVVMNKIKIQSKRIDVSEMEIPTIIYNYETENMYSGLSLETDLETSKDIHIFIKNNDFKLQVISSDGGTVKDCDNGYYLTGDGTYTISMLDPNGDKVTSEEKTVTIKKVAPVYSIEGKVLTFDPATVSKIELINLSEETDAETIVLETADELQKGNYQLKANVYYDITLYGSDGESFAHDTVET